MDVKKLLLVAGALVVGTQGIASTWTKADRIAEGHMREVEIDWFFPSNRIDWAFNPTEGRPSYNPEWTWQLNRMSFWRDLAAAYRETKDERYARAFARQLGDWLDQTGGVPPADGSNGERGNGPWRTIEAGLRLMGSWPAAYDAFKSSPAFTDALRRRFVASMRAQAAHIMRYHATSGNWMLMEMTGVYGFAVRFPDFAESARLRRESSEIFLRELRRQLLPDGLHYELSGDYHRVYYMCAADFYRLAEDHGFRRELPSDYRTLLERAAEGPLALLTPAFTVARFNDSCDYPAESLFGCPCAFFPGRKDFLWAATSGREGTPPEGATASRFLPYAGYAALRSGWDREATFLAFDVGPLGAGHFHQDKLGFTLWKGDEELVFDDGGGDYDVSKLRQYARTGYDHNTLLVDGLAQNRLMPRVSEVPIDAGFVTTATRDRIRGVYEDGFGPKELKLARHEREIVFDKPDAFTLTDTIASADGREHAYELLFHVDATNVVVSADGRQAYVLFGRKWDLLVEVVEGGTVSFVSGGTEPRISGWFVGRNGLTVHPAATISVKAPELTRDHRFVTRLLPFIGSGGSTFLFDCGRLRMKP